MSEAGDRLKTFLKLRNFPENVGIQQLTPDASTREYFRIDWEEKTAIGCVYPESFVPEDQSYLDVTNLFKKAELPVATIYDFDGQSGVIIQEDFGDTILSHVLEKSESVAKENLFERSISLIVRIQAATSLAYDLDSIASRLKFDEEKLSWELGFFETHYFESLMKSKLSQNVHEKLSNEFLDLSRELEKRAKYLCHRDFHAANLMLDSKDRLRIIDHQDARIGSIAYDLVSLLLDRVKELPDQNWLSKKKEFFLDEIERFGLERVSSDAFDYEFNLVIVQRCLKAIGTFSNQTANYGKTSYVQFIRPMFRIVLEACESLKKYPTLQQVVEGELLRS